MGKVVLEPITAEAVRQANERGAVTTNAPTAIVHADVETIDGALHLRLKTAESGRDNRRQREMPLEAAFTQALLRIHRLCFQPKRAAH